MSPSKLATLAIVCAVLLPVPSEAQDRASLIPLVIGRCQNFLLNGGPQVTAALADLNITLAEACECQAPIFLSALGPAELDLIRRNLAITGLPFDRFRAAIAYCINAATLRRLQRHP